VGEEVAGTLAVHGSEDVFELTAPSNGTLTARLSWAPTQGRLELWFGDILPSQPDGPPIVAEIHVAAGRKYVVKVVDGAPWDYDNMFLPYVLTTALK
jgi:hypothetical protein